MNTEMLTDAGVNYAEGVKRFAGKAAIYEKFLKRYGDDPTFGELEAAMQREDYETAFRSAHTLKGVAGNLSIKPLYDMLYEFVECLRNGTDIPKAQKMFPELKRIQEREVDVISRAM